jgi:4-hydroxysphinganine ceramide fatty acyl 2-hydroxylase
MEFTIKNKGQARLFKSDFLELLTKTHPLVIYSIYVPILSFMMYYGAEYLGVPFGIEVLLFFGGLLFWTFFEYLMHRYLFHWMTDSKAGKNFVYTLHGVHHEYPRDRERLFMPPVPSLIISSLIFGGMYLATGAYALSLFPGFISGYMLYGTMHYAIHSYAPPKYLKGLWRNHHLHHYKYPEKGFGVSSIIWDHVFRTVPKKEG